MDTDERVVGQVRPLAIEKSLLTRADGSVRFSQGQTAVLVSVTGPTEVKPRNELLDRAYLEVVLKSISSVSSTKERLLEEAVSDALEGVILLSLYPRTTIQIIIQVLHDDGSLLATAINGAILALLDAGVSMKSTATAVSCAFTSREENEPDSLISDPSKADENVARSLFCFTFSTASGDVISSSCQGDFTPTQLVEAQENAKKSAAIIEQFVRTTLEKKIKKQIKKK